MGGPFKKAAKLFENQVILNGKFPNKRNNGAGNLFFGPPIPGTCEPCLVKAQSSCITDNCETERDKKWHFLRGEKLPIFLTI